jgi:hypothetical protein
MHHLWRQVDGIAEVSSSVKGDEEVYDVSIDAVAGSFLHVS